MRDIQFKKVNYTFFVVIIPYRRRNQPIIKSSPPIGVTGPKKDTLKGKIPLIDSI